MAVPALFVIVLQDEATLGGSCGTIVCKVRLTEQANRISKQFCKREKPTFGGSSAEGEGEEMETRRKKEEAG